MPQINEDIISEINCTKDAPEEMKQFLKWLIEFERGNEDKDRFSYQQEIELKIESFLDQES